MKSKGLLGKRVEREPPSTESPFDAWRVPVLGSATLSVGYEEEEEAERAAREMFAQMDKKEETIEELDDFYAEEEEEEDNDDDDEETANATAAEEPEPMEVDWEPQDNPLDPRFTLLGRTSPEKYQRPAVAPLAYDGLTFQHVETTYDIDYRAQAPVIRLWGVTEQGNSVLVEDRTFRPYFYAAISSEEETRYVERKLEALLKEKFHTIAAVKKRKSTETKGFGKPLDKYVLGMEEHFGISMAGYHPPDKPRSRMIKITLAYPKHIAAARDALERAEFGRRYVTYEGNVPFELRYMIDRKIHGCQWLHLPRASFKMIPFKDHKSTAQYELHLEDAEALQALTVEERGDIAPMRFMSYDIEVLRKGPGFPTADKDPIIMVTCALHVVGKQPVDQHRVCFALRPPPGTGGSRAFQQFLEEHSEDEIYVFDDERDLLLAWRQYVIECDPDALTGWNIDNFDNPYMAGRSQALGIYKEFMSFTRLRNKRCWIRECKFESKAHGARVSKELLCEGRFSYDGLLFLLRGQMEKYPSYKLNYISQTLLGDQKLDVDYTQIPILYEGTDEDRTRLLWYCLKDTLLPLRLLDKLMAVVNGVEQSRVTGVPLKWLLSRGQGVKTDSAMLRTKADYEHRPSRSPPARQTGGGHVEEPLRGFYDWPIASLDFSSLYPSIMIAHNMCYTTKVSLEWARAHLRPEDYWIPYPSVDEEDHDPRRAKKMSKKERERAAFNASMAGKPVDFCFVKPHIKEGVLPKLLAHFLSTRAAVKRMMKTEKDPFRYQVLDGRQLAIKLCANSVYGYTKGHICRDDQVMDAVTSCGRNMLGISKKTVLAPGVLGADGKWSGGFKGRPVVDVVACKKAGIDPEEEPGPGQKDPRIFMPCEPIVVYGDTDSVMISFGNTTLADVMRFGKEASEACTAKFTKPCALLFEAVKLRALYLNRKRYAALQIENLIPGERLASAIARAIKGGDRCTVFKGLESKRRDNAPIGGGTQAKVLTILMHEADIEKAEQVVKDTVAELLMGRVDMSELVITKGLSKTEEQYARGGTKQQHVELVKRIKARSLVTGETVPETGDRVGYVMLAGTAKKSGKGASKANELSEDPLHAMKTHAPIDTTYYIKKQILPAVMRVFVGVHEPEKCVEFKSGLSDTALEGFKSYHRLFAPHLDHMKSKVVPRAKNFGIAAWARAVPTCLGCGSTLTYKSGTDAGPVCRNCDRETVRFAVEQKHARKRVDHETAWDICRKCQGGSFGKVTCSNMSCTNFFHREKVLTDLEDVEKEMKRFL